MQDDLEAMKQYYGTNEAWERRRKYYEEGPSREWQELYRAVSAVLGEDPGSERAQSVAERWLALSMRSYAGDPDAQVDSTTAWMGREHWPAAFRERIAQYNLEEITEFIKQTALCSRKRYFNEESWAKWQALRRQSAERFSASWQATANLFRDLEAALGEDPGGDRAQALAARWTAQMDDASGGDPGIKTALLKAWSDRRHWPATLRCQMEALHMMSFERFERAADFVDKALAAG